MLKGGNTGDVEGRWKTTGKGSHEKEDKFESSSEWHVLQLLLPSK